MQFTLRTVSSATIFLTATLVLGQDTNANEKNGLQLFRTHVRADLIHHCLECHGGKSVKADFDLSTYESLMESGFVGESAADSHVMQLITHDAEPKMPFKKSKLSPEIIERIGHWIDLGAPYDAPLSDTPSQAGGPMVVTDDDRQFWSFQPLTKPTPPKVVNEAWCRTDIDRFIMAKLETAGLVANADADIRTLRRRAAFGLAGLPPAYLGQSKQSASQFSDSPTLQQAGTVTVPKTTADYDAFIDELLNSPHYGERWARHWMDVARFAESYGYEQDYDRPNAYHYRDFLIKAFNSDMPFDQFVRWQLAGDEFAPKEPLALMATGFLGAGVFPTQLTEAEFESTRYDELDDMTATTGVAFLGLSVGCARCHDHKFDPIPTRDYYRLAATFTKTIRSEIELDLEPAANKQRSAEFAAKTKLLESALAEFESGPLQTAFAKWLKSGKKAATTRWVTLKPQRIEAKGKYRIQPDNSVLATGKSPKQDIITFSADAPQQALTAIRIEALAHDSLPMKGPGLASNGNFVLGDIAVALESTEINGPGSGDDVSLITQNVKSNRVELSNAKATHQQDTGSLSVAASIDADPTTGWAVDKGGIGKDNAAVFAFVNSLTPTKSSRLKITLKCGHPNAKHIIGRFRVSVSSHPEPAVAVGTNSIDSATAAAIKAVQNGASDSKHKAAALAWFRTTQPKWAALSKSRLEHLATGPVVKLTTVQVSGENLPKLKHHANGRGYPHFYETTHLLDRGDVHQKQEVVQNGLLQILTPPAANPDQWTVHKPENATTEFTRAALATWLTDPKNVSGQLAARVLVNRIWQHHFGRGIVATPNDFGFQGERPTHPKLLDWLAADFIEHGWKLKRLHKLIMTSSVYRQSSEFHSDRNKIDSHNNLLWRRTPRRLEAEAIRDSMLAVSGLLDRTMYGQGTLDVNMKRRSIYFFIKRSKLIPTMMLFDWPEHLVSIGERSTTTIAPQALMFMNSPQGRQYSEAFAAHIAGSPNVVNEAYQRSFGRQPSEHEAKLADDFLRRQRNVYATTGNTNPDETVLADFCQTLMSMNEFVYLD